MKVLIVASGNADYISPFILDQVSALKDQKIEIDVFLIKGKGISGYIKSYKLLKEKIKKSKPEIIHAHYGLSGLLSVFQRIVPVVTTFHGSDINMKKVRFLSRLADISSSKSIFVSKELAKKLNKRKPIIIPCGVDFDVFHPIDISRARKKIGLSLGKKYILFSSSFSNSVKNYPLAKEAMSIIKDKDLILLELKGYKRQEVALLMNAVDAVLLTSHSEGSPQFIKEAMACNTPVVSVDVGDVQNLIGNTEGCYIAERTPKDIACEIKKALAFNSKTSGRNKVRHLDNQLIAKRILQVYNLVKS